MNRVSSHQGPYSLTDAISDTVGGVARAWQGVQDGIARIFGAKDAGSLAKTVTGTGILTLMAAPLLTPVSASLGVIAKTVGIVATTLGIGGMIENTVTKNLARGSGKL